MAPRLTPRWNNECPLPARPESDSILLTKHDFLSWEDFRWIGVKKHFFKIRSLVGISLRLKTRSSWGSRPPRGHVSIPHRIRYRSLHSVPLFHYSEELQRLQTEGEYHKLTIIPLPDDQVNSNKDSGLNNDSNASKSISSSSLSHYCPEFRFSQLWKNTLCSFFLSLRPGRRWSWLSAQPQHKTKVFLPQNILKQYYIYLNIYFTYFWDFQTIRWNKRSRECHKSSRGPQLVRSRQSAHLLPLDACQSSQEKWDSWQFGDYSR